jgi:hypothetical protein
VAPPAPKVIPARRGTAASSAGARQKGAAADAEWSAIAVTDSAPAAGADEIRHLAGDRGAAAARLPAVGRPRPRTRLPAR